ncbi:MAG: hypothetical protein KDA89_24050 [Planctomycetaceae bacterium]|nr:hypothetical protein [Planctomycetaceae bacterium]
MSRLNVFLIMLPTIGLLSGCASLCDEVISMEMGCRNHILAQKAWGHWSWCYDDLDHPWHFAKGFKAGYRNVLDGGSGCQPTLPPQCYWKPKYQTSEGNCQIHSWFDGYSHGALAAKQDGYGHMGEIPISPTARANIEASRMRRPPNMFAADAYGGPVPDMGLPDEDGETRELNSPDAERRPLIPSPGNGNSESGERTIPLRPYE